MGYKELKKISDNFDPNKDIAFAKAVFTKLADWFAGQLFRNVSLNQAFESSFRGYDWIDMTREPPKEYMVGDYVPWLHGFEVRWVDSEGNEQKEDLRHLIYLVRRKDDGTEEKFYDLPDNVYESYEPAFYKFEDDEGDEYANCVWYERELGFLITQIQRVDKKHLLPILMSAVLKKAAECFNSYFCFDPKVITW